MDKKNKRLLWLAAAVTSPLIVLLLISFLLPILINVHTFKGKFEKDISQRIGGKITSGKIEIALFPAPHILFHNVSFSVGETAAGTLNSLFVYPRLLPLINGDVQIDKVQLNTPALNVRPPKSTEQSAGEKIGAETTSLRRESIAALHTIASRFPRLSVKIESGKLQYFADDATLLQFHHINGRLQLPPEQFKLDLTCESNLWKTFSMNVQMDNDQSVTGTMSFANLQPQLVLHHWFPSTRIGVADALLNLNADFSSKSFETLHVDLQGSFPYLTLNKQNETLVLKCKSLKGVMNLSASEMSVELQELLLDHPRLGLSGRFLKNTNPSHLELEVTGTEVDVDSTRKAALTLVGEISTAQKIFEIVKGGVVPKITFSTQGETPRDLGDSKNIRIIGSLINGNIFVPKAELDLTEVYGEVDIANGILQGEKLRARLENSRGSEGSLTIGLTDKDKRFHLDLKVDADLAQLPPILHRVVPNRRFTREIELIESFDGKARGRFVLGENLKSVKALVEVKDLQLTASYQRLPYPLQIRSGQFFYDGTKEVVSVTDLSGNLGKSSFRAFSGEVVWLKEMQLQILSKAADLFVPEIYPWIISYSALARILKEFKFDGGSITVDGLNLKGPLLSPAKWEFKSTGSVQDLAVDWSHLPGTLLISKGDFEAAPHKLTFIDSQGSMLDASFKASANLDEIRRGLLAADLDITGSLGPKTIGWIAGLSNLPSQFYFRPPLEVTRGRLVWKRDDHASFSGELLPTGGPRVVLDQTWQKERLIIKKMLIQDTESNGSISLDLNQKEFDLTFSGKLTKNTVDKLLQDNQMLAGWISGDFSAHVLLENYTLSTAQGELEGRGLKFPQVTGLDEVKSFSVKAVDSRLNVESAMVVWMESQLAVGGTVDFSADGLMLDLTVSLDGIEWREIERILHSAKDGAGKSEQLKRLRVQGAVKVSSNFFGLERFTLRPFQADIRLMPTGVELSITRAEFCGISTLGIVKASGGNVEIDIKVGARNQPLVTSLACLWDQKDLMQGDFNFDANITGRLMNDQFVSSLQGEFNFDAKDGRIYRFGLLEKIFSVLNFTEIFRGKLPNLDQEGFGYESFEMKGHLHDGEIDIEEAVLIGSSMEMVGRGNVNMLNKKIDLAVLVAPIKTLDVIISYIPLVNGILGRIVSIPVQVTGDLSNPTVIPLSPSAVGSELLGIMKKTMELPMRIIQPLMPDDKPATQKSQNREDVEEIK